MTGEGVPGEGVPGEGVPGEGVLGEGVSGEGADLDIKLLYPVENKSVSNTSHYKLKEASLGVIYFAIGDIVFPSNINFLTEVQSYGKIAGPGIYGAVMIPSGQSVNQSVYMKSVCRIAIADMYHAEENTVTYRYTGNTAQPW